eukprot:1476006-Alexandrium_andersonii.AAC.1
MGNAPVLPQGAAEAGRKSKVIVERAAVNLVSDSKNGWGAHVKSDRKGHMPPNSVEAFPQAGRTANEGEAVAEGSLEPDGVLPPRVGGPDAPHARKEARGGPGGA